MKCKTNTQMKIDYDKIIEKTLKTDLELWASGDVKDIKVCMKAACEQVLDEVIKSFPSHEHPEITKSILALKNEL